MFINCAKFTKGTATTYVAKGGGYVVSLYRSTEKVVWAGDYFFPTRSMAKAFVNDEALMRLRY